MNTIFEELDRLINTLNEAEASGAEQIEKKAEQMVKSIPVSPEMETADQGRAKAWEKLAKYFYELSMNSFGSGSLTANDNIDLPDDWMDPSMKGKMSGKPQDKEFERNSVVWDPDEELEKLKKDVNIDVDGSDDEFDDFDYRNNQFGDDADMEDVDTDDLDSSGGGSGEDDNRSEDEKLRDDIDDILDQMSDNGLDNNPQDGQQGQQSGQQGQQGQQEQQGGQKGGQQSGQQGGSQDGKSSENNSNDKGQPNTGGRQGKPTSKKDKELQDLKNALDNRSIDGVEKSIDNLKKGDSGSGQLAGENIGAISDKEIETDMSKLGISKKDIDEMSKMCKQNPMKNVTEEEMTELKKEVIDGLEKTCKAKGGSALAQTIVQHALKSKINNEEWRKLLQMFLKAKSANSGDMSKSMTGAKYGHKNHLWRDAILPTKTEGTGVIQSIYCFVDFSGSVNQDLVYVFLGRVIDLCAELKYTSVKVYGVGNKITLPREITGKMLKKDGLDVVLAQTWDYIDKQAPGAGTTNFYDIAKEIMTIRRKEREAVYLIFGDAEWGNDPCVMKGICGDRLLDQVCMLIYYDGKKGTSGYRYTVGIMKEIMKMKNIITTQASTFDISK